MLYYARYFMSAMLALNKWFIACLIHAVKIKHKKKKDFHLCVLLDMNTIRNLQRKIKN